jgi:hypothetical protein
MPRSLTRDQLLRRRLATQRLSGAPLPRAVDAVRLLTCVQSQDAPLADWSLGMRTRHESYAAVLAEQATGTFVRTHVLRPTWHFVAAEDLRWIQSLTGAKVLSSLAGRHRGLGLDAPAIDRAIATLQGVLAGRRALTRKQLTAEFAARGLLSSGEQMAHQLMTAEVLSVIASGPPAGTEHTYVLVDETIDATPEDDLPARDRPAAIRALTHRFVTGHGPVSDRDLSRWCTLNLTEIRSSLAELDEAGLIEAVEVEGEQLWCDPSVTTRTSRAHAAYLLSTFDEATLTYPTTGPQRAMPDHDRTRLLSEAGGGTTLVDGIDIGVWKRKVVKGTVEVRVLAEVGLSAAQVDAIEEATARLGRFLALEPRLTLS